MNKNTKRKAKENRKAVKTGDKAIINQNNKRNMCMVVVKEDGGGTMTRHIPIDKKKPFLPYKPKGGEWVFEG